MCSFSIAIIRLNAIFKSSVSDDIVRRKIEWIAAQQHRFKLVIHRRSSRNSSHIPAAEPSRDLHAEEAAEESNDPKCSEIGVDTSKLGNAKP